MKIPPLCPLCNAPCVLLDTVDFNKACLDHQAKVFPPAGIPVKYSICVGCGFCFAPELIAWPPEEFASRIYNDDYVKVDPEYVDARPRANAVGLVGLFGDKATGLRHLDYGGGAGLTSRLLCESGWQSHSYDPFGNPDVTPESLGRFDLITAFEVFEHVTDPRQLVARLRSLLAPGGVVIFSTMLSDGNIRLGKPLTWWYAAPRNGHISLFSRNSLGLLARDHGLQFSTFAPDFHVLFTELPPWARHITGG